MIQPNLIGKTPSHRAFAKPIGPKVFLPAPFEWTYKGFKRPFGRANVAEFVGRLMFS